jgi:hypothetical protein
MQLGVRSVEFFGLPGSGKTTLAKELLNLLQSAGVSASFSGDRMGDGTPLAQRTFRRLGLVAGQSPWNMPNYWRGTRLITAHGNGLRDIAHSMWNLISVQAMTSQHLHGRGFMVLDQGIVQAIWSARMREKQSDNASSWGGLLSDQWLGQACFVEVGCEIETAMERLRNRKQRTSRMQRPDRLQELAEWSRGRELISEIGAMTERLLGQQAIGNRFIRIRTDDGSSASRLAAVVLAPLRQAGSVAVP